MTKNTIEKIQKLNLQVGTFTFLRRKITIVVSIERVNRYEVWKPLLSCVGV